MSPDKNDTWQILHLKQTNTTPTENGALQKWYNLRKNTQRSSVKDWVIFEIESLNF